MVFIDTHATTRMPLKDLPDCREQPVCDPRPVCPVCGGLECLCRPRFFAGQLLTEDDLNRLEHYVVAKEPSCTTATCSAPAWPAGSR